MGRKIILRILKTILRIVKIILLRVELEMGYAERSRIFVQASAEGKFTWTMPSAAENLKANFRASECRGQASLVLCRAADKGAFYIDQLVELCVKCQLQ